MAKVLYISYTGLLQPLGESQVLGYLCILAREHKIILLSFERGEELRDKPSLAEMKVRVREAGIEWKILRYHKRLSVLATLYDVTAGLLVSLLLTARRRLDIVHCRSYVPSIIGLMLKKYLGLRFIFDMRGFWADERVEGGIWPAGSRAFRTAKWFERQFFLKADTIVSLTQAGAHEVRMLDFVDSQELDIRVIPTSTDLSRFRPQQRKNKSQEFVLGYIGSVGTWYLFEEVVRGFAILQKELPQATLLIVNRSDHDFIRACISKQGVEPVSVELVSAKYRDMPNLIARMDAGIFFCKPTFSKRASAPTRLGEFLASGVPCLANTGVGDVEHILVGERAGICVSAFDDNALTTATRRLIGLVAEEDIGPRCRNAATRYFSLEKGAECYSRIYESLT